MGAETTNEEETVKTTDDNKQEGNSASQPTPQEDEAEEEGGGEESGDEIVPRENDVLSGRGGLSNHHLGNKKYRLWVEEHKEEYRACHMPQKSAIAKKIMQLVKNQTPPGRFLKKNGSTWFELDDMAAEKKTKQALRENKETMTEIYRDALPSSNPSQNSTRPPVSSFADANAAQLFHALHDEPPPRDRNVFTHSLGQEELMEGESIEIGHEFSWSGPIPTVEDGKNNTNSSASMNTAPWSGSRSSRGEAARRKFAASGSESSFRHQESMSSSGGSYDFNVSSVASQWAGGGAQVAADPMGNSSPMDQSHSKQQHMSLDPRLAASWASAPPTLNVDEPDVATLLMAPLTSPHQSFNHGKSTNNAELLDHRPDQVKRMTSNQCETEETRPDLIVGQGSVKRAALSRDKSAVSNKLKAQFAPGALDNPPSNGANGRDALMPLPITPNDSLAGETGVVTPDVNNNNRNLDEEMQLLSTSMQQSTLGGSQKQAAKLLLPKVTRQPSEDIGMDPLLASADDGDNAGLDAWADELADPEPPSKPKTLGSGDRFVSTDQQLESLPEEKGNSPKPNTLGGKDRMSTEDYFTAVNEASLGPDGPEGLASFVDSMLQDPRGVLLRSEGHESLPDE